MIRTTLALAALLAAGACATDGGNPINNPTVRGAAVGAAVGAAAGAVIGNNTGEGDAGQGAAIGAVLGGATGAVVGSNRGAGQPQDPQRMTGPNGEPVVWDPQARRYYYTHRDGRTYWIDGGLRY